LKPFPQTERSFAGNAPAVVEATWRMKRGKEFGAEQTMAPAIWNEAAPRKYTRLHLFGHPGARVLSGVLDCVQWKYTFANLFVQQRSGPEADAVFPALIEPYVGEPFITEQRLLEIANNEADAQKAVAVEVKTKNGHTDVCFADGRPDKPRQLRITNHELRITGEFAFVSKDKDGLRQASLSGGTLLETPDLKIRVAQRERTGRVIGADYPNRTLTIDQAWPTELLKDRVFEVGVPGHRTTYTLAAGKRTKRGTALTVVRGADFYLSRVQDVDEAKQRIACAISLPFLEGNPSPGLDKRWVASNEEMTKFWRADYLGGSRETGRFEFQLDGKVSWADFGKRRGFYLWEYGVGDTVRQSTFVNVRRLADGSYEVQGDVDCEIAMGGKTRKLTAAGFAQNDGAVRIKP
jgi:hypothetical protein